MDLYAPASLPWRLVLGDGPEWDIGDTFLNGAKEADFVRNGNAKQIMSLSKGDTEALWNAVVDSKSLYFLLPAKLLINPFLLGLGLDPLGRNGCGLVVSGIHHHIPDHSSPGVRA